MRNATVTRQLTDQSYLVSLFENNQVVHTKTFPEGEYLEVLKIKEAWLNGEGPTLLAG